MVPGSHVPDREGVEGELDGPETCLYVSPPPHFLWYLQNPAVRAYGGFTAVAKSLSRFMEKTGEGLVKIEMPLG